VRLRRAFSGSTQCGCPRGVTIAFDGGRSGRPIFGAFDKARGPLSVQLLGIELIAVRSTRSGSNPDDG
jgi:hypothetical protein